MIQQINQIYSGGGRQNASAEEIYNSAKTWEESNNYSRAIDGYLEITESHSQDAQFLEEVWERAYSLAMKFEKGRLNEVVNIIGSRLMNIGRFNVAGEIYESIGDNESAVDCYI